MGKARWLCSLGANPALGTEPAVCRGAQGAATRVTTRVTAQLGWRRRAGQRIPTRTRLREEAHLLLAVCLLR